MSSTKLALAWLVALSFVFVGFAPATAAADPA